MSPTYHSSLLCVAITLTWMLNFHRVVSTGSFVVNSHGNVKSFERIDSVILLRGGKGKETRQPVKKVLNYFFPSEQKKGNIDGLREVLSKIKPATRAHMLVGVFCTLVHMIGFPAPDLFGLDINRFYQIWRPFTSVAYFGPPSMSMANSLYFLVTYGQRLESENGTGTHVWFLLTQLVILSALGLLLKFPFQAQALIASTVYVSSHLSPMDKMPFQFGLVITSWQLPFCMMIIDCLSQQSAAAAWPHLIGIFAGHVYHFSTRVWPVLGGKPGLQTPQLFIKWFGDKPSTNINGLDFRGTASAEDANSSSGSGSRKRGKKNLKKVFGQKKKGQRLGKA